MSVDVSSHRSPIDGDTEVAVNNLVSASSRYGADPGIHLSSGGQQLCLISPKGQVIRDEYLLAVTSLLLLNVTVLFTYHPMPPGY